MNTTSQLRIRPRTLAAALLSAAALAPLAHADHDGPPKSDRKDGLVSKSEVSAGALLISTSEPGRYVEAPIVAGEVKIDIAGPVIRTRVTQRFTNPSEKWVEGVYAFPLPEDAAVDTLKVVVGDRFIEGEIHERQAARQNYEAAAADGRKAGFIEQERPNLFTTSLANIGPGETVAIQIEYQDKARLDNGVRSTRLPRTPGDASLRVASRCVLGHGLILPRREADLFGPAALHPRPLRCVR